MPDDLVRYTTESGRVYTDEEELFLPSVTTVIDQKPEPIGVKKWKKKNDGTGDTKHWEYILMYKGNRGTLIHYELLNQLIDGDMYGTEEESSEDELKDEDEFERYEDDLEFALDAWDEICEQRGITKDAVLDAECFVTNTGLGYAGQFDLLYIDNEGDLVLSDLKTSKYVYDKHMMQLTAYENALTLDIDKLEVIRVYPDKEEWEVAHDGADWFNRRFIDFNSKDEVWSEFRKLREGMTNVDEEFKKIAEDGIQTE